MALTDLASLKAQMTQWAADRPDLVAQFQDCVDMTTNDLNKVLRARQQQAEVMLTPDENGVAALPEDYLEWRSVTADTNPRTVLDPLSPEGEVDVYPSPYGGWPSHFVIEDATITVMPFNETQIELKYWKRIPHLTEAEPVNWLLAENPNLYLFGAMKYVFLFTNSMARAQAFGASYSGLVDGMVREAKRAQWSRIRSRVAGRSTP